MEWMMLTAGLTLLKGNNKFSKFIFINSILLMITLIIFGFVLINESEPFAVSIIFVFIVFHFVSMIGAISKIQKQTLLSAMKSIPFELIILLVYVYLIPLSGDLFTLNSFEYTTIRMIDLPLHPIFMISGILYGIVLLFKYLKIKKVYTILFSCWILFQLIYSVVLLITYPFSKYSVSDGIFLYVPLIVALLYVLVQKLSKKN
ncbi:MAG: hypothetical protein CVV58_02815 [Tenericutes bacterium HGW-Tenericutes-3]|nr:MAG: hypothetical protein CVV58_02815 [Tenericutes bacterium HGW-Tenericutes-3]